MAPSTPRFYVITTLFLALVTTACSPAPTVDDDHLTIVVTTTIMGDIISSMVGSNATVEVLIPLGVDPHEFSPSSQQVALIHSADLVVANGLGLEAGLLDVLETASSDGVNVYTVGDKVANEPDSHGAVSTGESEHSHAHGAPDPHIWLDPILMALAVDMIAEQITAADQDNSTDWTTRSSDYAAKLLEVNKEIVNTLASVPQNRRLLVTNHDSLQYFAEAYDFEVIGTVFPGRSPVGEPSSEDLVELTGTLREYGLRAIFGETTEASTLASAIAAELGGTVQVIELHTGSLGGPGSGAETYIDLLRTNALLIAEALGS